MYTSVPQSVFILRFDIRQSSLIGVKYLVGSGDVVWLPRFLTRDGDLP